MKTGQDKGISCDKMCPQSCVQTHLFSHLRTSFRLYYIYSYIPDGSETVLIESALYKYISNFSTIHQTIHISIKLREPVVCCLLILW